MTMPLPQSFGDIFSTAVMGGWSFLGGIMRGGTDWRDPKGKFSIPRFGVSIATALVLGQIASAIGHHLGWEPNAIGALSGFVGYLGPAATMQFFQKKLLGGGDASSDPAAKD